MTIQQYGKAIIRKCSVNGVDITNSIRTMYTGATIMTPFQMSKISVIDSSLIQDALYESGVPIDLVYSSGDGSNIREFNFLSMASKDGAKFETNKSSLFEITGVTQSYFNMQGNHTSFHQNVTAADALKKLHKEVDSKSSLSVTKTKGMIGDREPFHLRSITLGKGVNNIRSRMTDEKYKSGAYLYYMDQESNYHAKPLEELMDKADGPQFTQHVGGKSFINEQSAFAHNIVAMRKGGAGSDSGADNADNYYSSLKQKGGDSGTGFNWQTMEYKSPSDKNQEQRKTPGATEWKGEQPKKSVSNLHKFHYDANQKKQEDFEGDEASQNAMRSIALQGSTSINVPMEGGLKCKVGSGCNLDLAGDSGTLNATKSKGGGRHLIIAQGEYIFMGDNGLQGTVALQTASGGTQGDLG